MAKLCLCVYSQVWPQCGREISDFRFSFGGLDTGEVKVFRITQEEKNISKSFSVFSIKHCDHWILV